MVKCVQNGFTMIEMMVTLIVVGILAAIAAPAFTSLIASQNIRTSVSMLQSSLLQARSEAIKRNAIVTVSPNGGQWVSGWTVSVLASGEVISSNNKITQAVITGPAPASVQYNNSGRPSAGGGSTFKFSSSLTSDIRCLNVDLSGMPMITTSGC